MAIDLQKTRENIYKASMTINKMLSLVDAALTGKVSVEGIDINFTQTHKDDMINKYSELKVQLVDIFKDLP